MFADRALRSMQELNWEAADTVPGSVHRAPSQLFGVFFQGQDADREARPPAREQGLPEEKGQEGFLGKARVAPRRGKYSNGGSTGGPSRTRVIGGDSRKPRFRTEVSDSGSPVRAGGLRAGAACVPEPQVRSPARSSRRRP